MDIEVVADESQIIIKKKCILPEDFRLVDSSKILNGNCTVPKELFEKWLPLPKMKELNWIVQEVLEDSKMDSIATETVVDTIQGGDSSENGQNGIVVREFTVLPQSMEEETDICNFIYPIVNDPYMMGRIACTALLNKLFVKGILSCERAIIILSLCDEWPQSIQESVEQAASSGFKETAAEANIEINQVEVHLDNVCMIGGVLGTNLNNGAQPAFPNVSCVGDVIVLTKPLGVQMALNAYKLFQQEQTDDKDRLTRIISAEDLKKAYDSAIFLLTSLNLLAVKLTQGFEVHAVTEINGHSLMEHSQMLAEQQTNEVAFFIYNLPLIGKMLQISKVLGNQPDLILGNIPEICGGLLLVMPREQAASYCRRMLNEGHHAWIVGMVEKGRRSANMIKKARVIEWNWNSEPVV